MEIIIALLLISLTLASLIPAQLQAKYFVSKYFFKLSKELKTLNKLEKQDYEGF